MADLRLSCESCGTPALPTARFCSHCGHPFKAGAADAGQTRPERTATELRQVTVVFCDLVGSTSFVSEMDTEDFTDLLGTFHHHVTSLMTRYGGFVARYMGDGTLTFFGYPQASEDDVERAVRASLDAVGAVSAIVLPNGRRLHVRVGISTGVTIVGDVIGTGGLRGLDIAGEAPNLAARLQSLAEPDTVLVDQSVRRQLGNAFECHAIGARRIKGWTEPVPVWRVLRPAPVGSRLDAPADEGRVPLIGRAAQLGRLLSLWEAARDGKGQIALLVGEPGIGKSRLVAELLQGTAVEQPARLSHFCTPHHSDVPLHPCIQQIERTAGFASDDSAELKRVKLKTSLQGMPDEALGLVADLLMIPEGTRPASLQLAPQQRRARMLQALLGTLIRTSAGQPIVVVFEDAHWGDPTTLELLSMAVRRIAEFPILLVVTARPEFQPEWSTEPCVHRLNLLPLATEEAGDLVRCMSGPAALSPAQVTDIVARSDGVPLFLEEVTKAALEAGDETKPRAERKLASAPVPVTIHASLIARLDRLAEVRWIAEVAAAIGRDFDFDMLASVADCDDQTLRAALARLVASGLVLPRGPPGSGDYRFKHALIQDAAYGMIVRQHRRRLHRRIAEAIETRRPQLAAAQPQLLAHHWTEAAAPEKAVERWLQAGVQSLARSLVSEALAQLGRGLTLKANLPDTEWRRAIELDLLFALGKAQIAALGHAAPMVGSTFDRARTLCEQIRPPRQLPAVLFGQWTYALLRAELSRALRLSEEMLAVGEREHDPVGRLVGCYTNGITHFYMGDLDRARAFLQCGIALFDPSRREEYARSVVSDPRVVMGCFLSWISLCTGELQEADRICRSMLDDARQLGHTYTLAHAVWQRASVILHLDAPSAALPWLEELQSLAHEHEFPFFEALAMVFKGWCRSIDRDVQDGLALMREGFRLYRSGDSRLFLPSFLRIEAELLRRAGKIDQGLDALRKGAGMARRSGAHWDAAEHDRIRGKLLRARGEFDAAERAFVRAIRTAGDRGAKLFELRAAVALARLLADRGRQAEARKTLAPVCRWFDNHPPFPELASARAIMHDL